MTQCVEIYQLKQLKLNRVTLNIKHLAQQNKTKIVAFWQARSSLLSLFSSQTFMIKRRNPAAIPPTQPN